MTRITALLRPHQLEEVKAAVAVAGVQGMTVSDVRGSGDSESGWEGGLIRMPIRARLETVVEDDQVEEIVSIIIASARTGEPNDGKIFLEPVSGAVRIRTGETGPEAI
jgi:nitrogen regulatory protein P-II 1